MLGIVEVVLTIGQDHQVRIIHAAAPAGFDLCVKGPFNLVFRVFCVIRRFFFVIAHSTFPGGSHTAPVRVQHPRQTGTEGQIPAFPLEVVSVRINERSGRYGIPDDFNIFSVGNLRGRGIFRLIFHCFADDCILFFCLMFFSVFLFCFAYSGTALFGFSLFPVAYSRTALFALILFGIGGRYGSRSSGSRICGFFFTGNVKTAQYGDTAHAFRLPDDGQRMFPVRQVRIQVVDAHLGFKT